MGHAIFKPHLEITLCQCADTMRDSDNGDLPFQLQYRIGDTPLCLIIKCRGRLVEHEDFGALIEGSCDADALALTAGELDAPLANHRPDPLWLRTHKIIELCHSECLMYALIIDLIRRLTEGNVLANGRIGQIDGLWDIGDIRLPRAKFLANVYAIDHDLAARRNEKTQENVDERGLPRARWAENADKLPFWYREADILEHLVRSAWIVKPQMLHTDHIGKWK